MTRPANFDRLARVYQVLEYATLGPLLERTRNYFLPQLTSCRHALVFGDGDGRFLARLLAQWSDLDVDAVDSSRAMLRELRRRCAASAPRSEERLRTHLADARSFVPERQHDLVVTHFFLDCLTEPELDRMIARTAPRLAPGALWVVSDFRIPTTGPMHVAGVILVRSLYFAFGLLTGLHVAQLPAHAPAFRDAGLVRAAERRFCLGLLFTELWVKPPALATNGNQTRADFVSTT